MTYTRDEYLISIRPKIDSIKEVLECKNCLDFQNQTLRPICKFQNETILNFISFYLKDKNLKFTSSSSADKLSYINSIFLRDTAFKNYLKGIIIGHFTHIELDFYTKNKNEINKRILDLVKTRFLSQFQD